MKETVLTERSATPPAWKQPEARSSRSDFLGCVFAFLIPTLIFVEVNIGGRLFLSELLLLGMLPFLLMARGQLLLAPLPKTLIAFGIAWLLAQIVTDVIRDTPFEDWSRGWAKIVFLLLNFSAIYLYLYGKNRRFFLFAAGIAIGQVLQFLFNPSILAEDFPWKFGYGAAVTLLALLVSLYVFSYNKRWPLFAVMLGMGVLNLYLDFRSLGLICLLTAVGILTMKSGRMGINKITQKKVLVLALLFGVMGYGIASLYDYGAGEGWFGREVKEKYLWQSSGDMGVILGGRSEILASSQAVMDSPIIGHGSWAKDRKYIDILEDSLIQYGYQPGWLGGSDLIPSHSYIMGAWVEAGIVGAVFWFFGLFLAVRALIAIYGSNSSLTPLIAFVAFNLLWNIPFSPLGAEGRLYAAYDLSLMIFALASSKFSMATKGRA